MCVEIGGRHLVLASPELQPSVCSNWDVLKLVHTSIIIIEFPEFTLVPLDINNIASVSDRFISTQVRTEREKSSSLKRASQVWNV